MRPVTERQQEAHDKQAKVHIVEDDVEYMDDVSKLERGIFHRLTDDDEGNVIIALWITKSVRSQLPVNEQFIRTRANQEKIKLNV